ncbi:MAG TPA: hypothetical protein DEQ40_00700, partial [Oxalobacteraceae bacterium]|nr:hypothetical protein [Oxalobacteraceae bacterium]
MKLIAKTVIAAALSALALSASAMTPIQDADLSQVTGQDGVSIAADLHINIGSFVYTDTDVVDSNGLGGGSVSFNNIKINGTIAATLDIISKNSFSLAAAGPLGDGVGSKLGVDTTNVTAANAGLAAFVPAGDVVQIAIPQVAIAGANHLLNVSVDSIKMGNSTASFGSFAMNDIKLQG